MKFAVVMSNAPTMIKNQLQMQASVFANDYNKLRGLLVSYLDSQRGWNHISAHSGETVTRRSTAKSNAPGGVADMDIGSIQKGSKGKS